MHAFEDMSYNIVDKIHQGKSCFILHITGTILAADYREITAVMRLAEAFGAWKKSVRYDVSSRAWMSSFFSSALLLLQ